MYKVIGTPRSRSLRVYWMLEELGLDYDMIDANPRSPEAKEYNPTGKVPALFFEGQVITDSVAIMQFLADRHEKLTFKAGTIDRAVQDSFTFFACDEIDGSLWTIGKHSFALPEAMRVPEVIPTAKIEFANAMKTLEIRLGDNEFVMGATITVPDLLLAHCAGWAEKSGVDMPKGAVGDYFKRLRSRPALRRAMAKSAQDSK
ncbi:MAG: glutathione S-transferase family protein [Rhodobacteraceae bacterium]|nr:glutathione S-transferase family protein [Paracoccaceae bacterium]